jgi:chorismate-pyruvate lyase
MVSIKIDSGSDGILPLLRELEAKACIRLSLAEKILLAEIGTVEQMLSIILDDNVTVKVIEQREYNGTMERVVNLVGEEPIIVAKSTIDTTVLPEQVVEDIRAKRLGLGSILGRHRLETYRSILELGYEGSTDTIYRVYDIIYKGVKAFTIREEILRSALSRKTSNNKNII